MEGGPGPVEKKSVNSESLNQDDIEGAQKTSVFSNFGIGRSLESLISKQEHAQAEIAKKASGTVKRINSFLEGADTQQPQQTTGSRNSRLVNSASALSSPTDKGASASLFDPVLLYGPEPSVSKFSSGQGLVQKSVYTSEEVLLSNIDPELGHLLHEMGSQSNGAGQGNYTWVTDKDQCFSGDIVFAKTHKTGGTTVTNMLLRHAEKHQLSVGLPIEHRWELAGYPADFDSRLVSPQLPKYNIMCHHMRFNKPQVSKLVSQAAQYLTILRDPVTNFESLYGFFKDYPFPEWQGQNRSMDEFFNAPEKYYNKSTPWYFRAKNYMSFDLGFDHESAELGYIQHVIREMEDTYKLVMITDRYEESMILLKDMLCLDYEDIIYLPLKVRTDTDRKRVSSETAAKVKRWNRLDTAIYEYFSKRFDELTVSYGQARMQEEVKIFREKLKDVEAQCVEDYDTQSLKPWVKRIKLRKRSGDECQRLVWGEVKYADHLRALQEETMTLQELEQQRPLAEQQELMYNVQKTILGDQAAHLMFGAE